ncbi:transglutaminase domain-containing protein [Microbulbifer pacificus]|uniref:Transglutaminase domain-containing protein n=1 Tax=Microbulbifer pacificus TaxID=407164 RepID=A0AAU0MVB5_9GAMM|nr:transglutaminase domain-containing protein [Microbulbifer pacificus]WOX04388.1 transglutaminase domain-containing protein [Microbulbifer pacificus]
MRWIALLISLIQFGCASGPGGVNRAALEVDTATLLAAAGEAAITLAAPDTPATAPPITSHAQALLAVSPEMRAFVDSIDPTLSPNQRFRRILRTLKMDRFELDYDLNTTTTAAEAFAQQRGNCISFSALMVALAREVGLEANFNLVEAPLARRTTTGGNGRALVQNVLHINAEVSIGWSSRVIEFNFGPYSRFPQRELSDATVQTYYLNNRALELSHQQRIGEAFALLREGLSIDPDSSMLWNSLGYLYRLTGELELAEMSYTQALNLEGGNAAAKNNLRRVYELQGLRALTREENPGEPKGKGS